MASSMAHSEKLRKQGNELYKQISDGGFCLTIRRVKLQRALQLYTQALNASSTRDEKASSCKNLGMLHLLWCKSEINEQLLNGLPSLTSKHLSLCKSHIYETIIFLLQAKEHAVNTKPQNWLHHLELAITNVVIWATEQSALLSNISHSPLLQYVCQAFENASPLSSPAATVLAYKNYTDVLFKEAIALKLPDESMDYKGCHSLLHACSLPLRKATSIRVTTDEERSLQEEMKGLEESLNVHICICEAMQAIALGDKALSKGVLHEEDMDMESVKGALDHYRQASLATRELDMETEAIAMSKIGGVYANILKMEEAAHKYYFQATKLALTVMSPRIMRADWYKASVWKVKEHQEKVASEERAKGEKDRRPVLERMKEKLATLSKEAGKGAESFLKFLYEKHPHPNLERNRVVPNLNGDKDKMKAALKKAILHYHPDTNTQFGEDWKVLCEEICKHLNVKYENIK